MLLHSLRQDGRLATKWPVVLAHREELLEQGREIRRRESAPRGTE